MKFGRNVISLGKLGKAPALKDITSKKQRLLSIRSGRKTNTPKKRNSKISQLYPERFHIEEENKEDLLGSDSKLQQFFRKSSNVS